MRNAVLDRHRLDVFSTEQHHRVFGATENLEAIIECINAQVTRIQPAIFDDLRSVLGRTEIPLHDLRPFDVNLSFDPPSFMRQIGIGIQDFLRFRIHNSQFASPATWDPTVPMTSFLSNRTESTGLDSVIP